MNELVTARGGAKIGWVNSTWPLAKLTAGPGELAIDVFLDETYRFRPDEVVSLERYGHMPLLSSGVRVKHTKSQFPSDVIFWCFGSPERLIDRIIAAGFRPTAQASQVPERNGIAFRASFLIGVVAIWNVLFLADRLRGEPSSTQLGPFSLIALALLFLAAIGLLNSEEIQAIALKPGRSASEVRSVAKLVMIVSGGLFVGFLLSS